MTPFPISEAQPIFHDNALPGACDVVVIGGGVIGVSTALFLARAGQNVVLLEKGRIAGEQSSRNWGWIRVQGRDPAEIPIAIEAQALWRELAAQVDADIGLTQAGVAFLADKDSELAGFEDWLDHAHPHDLDTRVLSASQTAALLPQATTGWAGALWTPSDMRAEPFLAVPALARLAAKHGTMIVEGCAVRLLDVEGGRVAGVVTERGRIRAGRVVLAGGAWSSLLLRRHGISIPQLSVRATVARTAPMDEVFAGGAVDGKLAFRRRTDGGYTLAPSGFHELYIGPDALRAFARFLPQLWQDPLGTKYLPKAPASFPDGWGTPRRWSGDAPSPFEAMRVLNPAPNAAKVAGLARDFSATFPGLGDTRIAAAWAGMIDVMPDVVPVVDRADALPGLTVCTGMCGHGFGIGPAFGRITADLAMARDPGHDLTRFRLNRFSDGSKLTLGPNL
ncbi:FAD-binding oxidoreductase [Aliiroseovarius subalbicans]|uniref:NAD(P)/FAD-dependent oxidoreductase n=1 Tax=Aliiroseovarius subalbicans TaxID=2925840 RepID=UPI001F55F2AF|nr:FAD-binding oxidoreductase [Aliiroseovarius subalbicans]MCI2397998.1 FAD-binding oxidoreductase [Aliiroseovarius subalbicans]